MPKQLRYGIKQKLTGVENELRKAQFKLVEVALIYKDGYPDYEEALNVLVAAIDQIIDNVTSFSSHV